MSAVKDYRIPQAKAHRLQAECYRLEAEAMRLFWWGLEHSFIASTEALAVKYDAMAADLEAKIAADRRDEMERAA